MHQICMSGLDWNSAGLDIREKLSFTAEQAQKLNQALRALDGIEGAVLLSTCNRTEVYLSVTDPTLPTPGDLLCRVLEVDSIPYWSHRTGKDAARHLMEVAGGMQSHIWGEDQIITQVKQAAALSREVNCTDSLLETLFRCAATAGKELKSKLRLTDTTTSAAHAAVRWLQQQLPDDNQHILVIGNGKMGRLCADLLVHLGWRVTITLRTYHHGDTLVPYGCTTVAYDERYTAMEGIDAVISATTSPHHTISAQHVAQRFSPPLFWVDLSVPRDIDPAVAALPGMKLANIDDLGEAENRTIPAQAEEIMEKHLLQLEQWQHYRKALPALDHLKQAVVQRVLSTAGDCDESLVELAVNKAVDLLSGGLKEHLDPELLEEQARKIELRTRPRGKSGESGMIPLRFPLFIDLAGQKVAVVGGGKVAGRRVGVLRQFGASVTLIAPECANCPEGVEWLARTYQSGDLVGCTLVVAATDDRAINQQVGEDATSLGIPVSVCDAPEECTFFFPAVCAGDGLVAGVVSDGTDHHRTARAAKAIRETLKEL